MGKKKGVNKIVEREVRRGEKDVFLFPFKNHQTSEPSKDHQALEPSIGH
jgi:hypothetical protein